MAKNTNQKTPNVDTFNTVNFKHKEIGRMV